MGQAEIARVTPFYRWHAYRLEERHAPWKVFLPASGNESILAVGLDGPGLASLARSWPTVSAVDCAQSDLEWAAEQGKSLGQDYQFQTGHPLELVNREYSAVVLGTKGDWHVNPATIFRCLMPGGAAAWVGSPWQLPCPQDLGKQGFHQPCRYAVLPPGKGKIIIPLDEARSARTGLYLYNPYQWHNRLAAGLGRLASFFSLQRLLGLKQVMVARKPGRLAEEAYFFDWLGQRLPQTPVAAATYSGWTKLVLQLLDGAGQVIGIAKLADVPLGRNGIHRESLALQSLKLAAGMRSTVPSLLAEGEWGGMTVQVQSAIGFRGKINPRLTPAHHHFLLDLSQIDVKEGTLNEWPHWPAIWHWAHEGSFGTPKEAEALRVAVEHCANSLMHRKVWFHRVHGDFTPWHALKVKKGLAVLDWEESEPHGLPFTDAVHFVMSRQLHLQHAALPKIQLLLDSPFSLGRGDELANLAMILRVPSDLVRLAVIYELFRMRGARGYQ